MILIDTNVLIDVLAEDPVWLAWSAEQLERHSRLTGLIINEIGYAELAVHIETQTLLDNALANLGISLEHTPTEALFVAGKVFRRYRMAGGPRLAILPDFFIGAHADVLGIQILTRDVRRYRTYFPNVKLIAPDA